MKSYLFKYKNLLLVMIVLITAFSVPVSASPVVDVLNVKDYGAVGNGTTDDTTAFQNAITASTAQKKPVYVPYGTYKITQVLNLTDQLVFGEPSGSWTSDQNTLPTIKPMGSNKSAFKMNAGASISGLNFEYAQNESGTPTTYAPTIMLSGVGVRISNVRINHAWIGIDTTAGSNTGRLVIEDVFISKVAYRGMIIDGGWDASTLHNVEVWTPQDMYGGYFLNNGIGIIMNHNDAFRISNALVFAANTGMKFVGNANGTAWGTLSNVTTDFCLTGLEFGAISKISVSGGTFMSHYSSMKVTGSDASVTITGADIKSNGAAGIDVVAGYTVSITGNNIDRTAAGFGAPAVNVSGGSKVIITGNNMSSLSTGVQIGTGGNVVMVSNNIIDVAAGGVGVANASGSPFIMVSNNIVHP